MIYADWLKHFTNNLIGLELFTNVAQICSVGIKTLLQEKRIYRGERDEREGERETTLVEAV